MGRKLVKIIILLMTLQYFVIVPFGEAASFDQKVSEKKIKVTSGVNHEQALYRTGSIYQTVNILDVNLFDKYINLEMGIPNPINILKTTTLLAQQNSYDGHRVVGAVNGSFFLANGFPANLLASNNQIINYGILGEKFESPTQNPVAFGITKDGRAIADFFQTNLSFTINGKKYPINRINNVRSTNDNVLYSSSQKTTGTNEWGSEIIVQNVSMNTKDLHFGDHFSGSITKVTQYSQPGNSVIPEDGFVLSIQNKELASELGKLESGTPIEVELSIDEKWRDAQFILAAGPLLVKDGKVNISMPNNSSFASSRQPRTAVAVDSTGKRVFLVTVDGGQIGYSNGASLQDFASYLISKGASAAINLDGGGSTTMAVLKPGYAYPLLVNRPSDGSERRVTASLQVVSSALYVDLTDSHWAYESIKNIKAKNLINGYPDGTFKADSTITRAETATIISRALNLKATKTPNFTDVSKNHYAYNDIAAAAEKGIVIGREIGKFVPEGKLTRAEMSIILKRAFQLSGTSSVPFTDVRASNWAYSEIQALVANQLVDGFPDNTFKPNQQITRAEFAALLDRVLNR